MKTFETVSAYLCGIMIAFSLWSQSVGAETVFIIGGSNCHGRGITARLLPSARMVPENIRLYDNGKMLRQLEPQHGIEAGLFKRMKSGTIAKICQGGTPLHQMVNDEGKYFTKVRAARMRLNLSMNERITFILMKEGSDSRNKKQAKAFQGNLSRLRASLKKHFGKHRLLIGHINPRNTVKRPYARIVRKAKARFAGKFRGVEYVDLSHLPKADDVHLSTSGVKRAGKKLGRLL